MSQFPPASASIEGKISLSEIKLTSQVMRSNFGATFLAAWESNFAFWFFATKSVSVKFDSSVLAPACVKFNRAKAGSLDSFKNSPCSAKFDLPGLKFGSICFFKFCSALLNLPSLAEF